MPVVVIDSREQYPLKIENFPSVVQGLPVGDYGILGFSDWENPQFIVERKSLGDLISSLTHGRERFLKEIQKLRQFRFACLLIEATRNQIEAGEYRSQAIPQSILGSLDSIKVRYGIHLEFCENHEKARKRLEDMIRHFARGIEKDWQKLQTKEVKTA